MPKRGKVLRDPHVGPGLLMVEGKQYPFLLEGLWRSEVPAKPGLVVNVDFDDQGNLNAITAVPQSQLDQEQAELSRAGAPNRVLEIWTLRTGTLTRVAAAAVLVVSWFFLTAVSVHLPLLGKLDFTLWQILGYLNSGNSLQFLGVSGNPDSGVFGFVAILVLAGPFLHYFWKDPRAMLCGTLPLSFMVFVAYRMVTRMDIVFATHLTGPNGPLPTDLHYGLDVISVGLGTYLSTTVAIYFAVLSTRQFMADGRHRRERLGRPLKVAA